MAAGNGTGAGTGLLDQSIGAAKSAEYVEVPLRGEAPASKFQP